MMLRTTRQFMLFAVLLSVVICIPFEAESSSRSERCSKKPIDQWCISIGAGASLSGNSNGDVFAGVGARAGVFVLPHVGVSVLSGITRGAKRTQYDLGTSLDIYAPIGDVMLVPGYGGGLFWIRGSLSGNGTTHGPHLSLLFKLAKRAYLGVRGSYTFVNFEGSKWREYAISPSLLIAF